jgi:hypothetical protein
MPSTVIRSFHYDAPRRRLEVEFLSGRRYSYYGVPPAVAEAMRAADSKGGYFNRCIRDRYAFTRLV